MRKTKQKPKPKPPLAQVRLERLGAAQTRQGTDIRLLFQRFQALKEADTARDKSTLETLEQHREQLLLMQEQITAQTKKQEAIEHTNAGEIVTALDRVLVEQEAAERERQAIDKDLTGLEANALQRAYRLWADEFMARSLQNIVPQEGEGRHERRRQLFTFTKTITEMHEAYKTLHERLG